MSVKVEYQNQRYAKLDDTQEPVIEDPKPEEDSKPEDEKKPETPTRGQAIVICSLIVFTVVQIINPILVRVAHKQAKKDGFTFLGSVTVFSTEIVKTLLCCIMITINEKSVKKLFISLYESFTINKYETLKICLPALLFVVQNNLSYFALQRIDATLFLVTYQLRLLTTACMMMFILGRRFSYLQWLALFMALVGVITVQVGGGDQKNRASEESASLGMSDQIAGLTAVLVMCLTTAFGCVYMEAVLKKSKADIFLQNIRLSLVSLPLAAATIFSDYETIKKHGFFMGWNGYVLSFVPLSAFSGIIVSSVIRYADNIKKSFCQALALGATAFVSIFLGDSSFSFYLLGGVALVVIAVILYAASPSPAIKPQEQEVSSFGLENGDLDKSAR